MQLSINVRMLLLVLSAAKVKEHTYDHCLALHHCCFVVLFYKVWTAAIHKLCVFSLVLLLPFFTADVGVRKLPSADALYGGAEQWAGG